MFKKKHYFDKKLFCFYLSLLDETESYKYLNTFINILGNRTLCNAKQRKRKARY